MFNADRENKNSVIKKYIFRRTEKFREIRAFQKKLYVGVDFFLYIN